MKGEQVNNRIKLAIQNTLKTAIKNRDRELFNQILAVIKSANLSNDKDYELNVKAEYYEQISDWNNLYKVTKEHIAFKHDDPRLLNDAAERFFKYARDNDKEDLRLALNWVKKSVEFESECYNNFTLGKLYNALNDKDMALATFEKCIEIGKLRGTEEANIYIKEAERRIDDIKLK
jgi:tetratricopeptide (TPR) repeat protein